MNPSGLYMSEETLTTQTTRFHQESVFAEALAVQEGAVHVIVVLYFVFLKCHRDRKFTVWSVTKCRSKCLVLTVTRTTCHSQRSKRKLNLWGWTKHEGIPFVVLQGELSARSLYPELPEGEAAGTMEPQKHLSPGNPGTAVHRKQGAEVGNVTAKT